MYNDLVHPIVLSLNKEGIGKANFTKKGPESSYVYIVYIDYGSVQFDSLTVLCLFIFHYPLKYHHRVDRVIRTFCHPGQIFTEAG